MRVTCNTAFHLLKKKLEDFCSRKVTDLSSLWSDSKLTLFGFTGKTGVCRRKRQVLCSLWNVEACNYYIDQVKELTRLSPFFSIAHPNFSLSSPSVFLSLYIHIPVSLRRRFIFSSLLLVVFVLPWMLFSSLGRWCCCPFCLRKSSPVITARVAQTGKLSQPHIFTLLWFNILLGVLTT